MLVYRIAHQNFAQDISGTGCLYVAGRWHYQGTRVLYTSEHVSLAKLELLANTSVVPKNQMLLTLEIPDSAERKVVRHADLPDNWWQFPYLPSVTAVAEEWIEAGKFWIMQVPSAQSFTEHNYLLNPMHPDHQGLKIVHVEPVRFDERLK